MISLRHQSIGPEFIADRSIPVPESGCWIWLLATDRNGYGICTKSVRLMVGSMYAHRVSYAVHTGSSLRRDIYIRHKCDTPLCVNPDHLEPGTQLENMRDAIARGRNHMINKTHCIRGHQLFGTNIYVDRHGHRVCKACACIHTRNYLRRKAGKDAA